MFETTKEQYKDTCERSSFYQRWKEIMEYRSMSPTELSIASGINILEIDAYLSNTVRYPKTAYMEQLSKALHDAVGWLMGYSLSIHPKPITTKEYSNIVIDHGIKIVYPQDEDLGLLMAYWQELKDQQRRKFKLYPQRLIAHIQENE